MNQSLAVNAAGISKDRFRILTAKTKALIYVFIVAMQAMMALGFSANPHLKNFHAMACLIFGIYFAIIDRRGLLVANMAAYIVGSEILWRIAGGAIFWEYAKFAISVIFFTFLLLHRSRANFLSVPTIFLLLFLPSMLVMSVFEKGMITFNLSGPLSLGISVLFFRTISLTDRSFQRLLSCFLVPITAALILCLFHLVEDLNYQSYAHALADRSTSAGYNPNQLSALLGLGAFAYFWTMMSPSAGVAQILLGLFFMGGMFAQAMLSYSRGGVWNAVGAILVGCVFLYADARFKKRVVRIFFLFVIFASVFVVPKLVELSDGVVGERFMSFDATGRDQLAIADLEVFLSNPILGVGPGESQLQRGEFTTLDGVSAHTEYTRALAEHGLFGLGAILLLFSMGFMGFRKARSRYHKALVGSLISWTLLYMLHSAMRLAAPGFIFGLALAQFQFQNLRPLFKRNASARQNDWKDFKKR